jgi:hypothetical protein
MRIYSPPSSQPLNIMPCRFLVASKISVECKRWLDKAVKATHHSISSWMAKYARRSHRGGEWSAPMAASLSSDSLGPRGRIWPPRHQQPPRFPVLRNIS